MGNITSSLLNQLLKNAHGVLYWGLYSKLPACEGRDWAKAQRVENRWMHSAWKFNACCFLVSRLPPIDTIWAMMIVWRTRRDYRTARAVLEAIIAFSAMHTYYEQLQLLQVKQICLCLTGFTSLCLDAYVFLCSLVFHCRHVVLL